MEEGQEALRLASFRISMFFLACSICLWADSWVFLMLLMRLLMSMLRFFLLFRSISSFRAKYLSLYSLTSFTYWSQSSFVSCLSTFKMSFREREEAAD